MLKASPVELRKCIEAANMLASVGIRFVPIPAWNDAEYAALSQLLTDKLESMARDAEINDPGY